MPIVRSVKILPIDLKQLLSADRIIRMLLHLKDRLEVRCAGASHAVRAACSRTDWIVAALEMRKLRQDPARRTAAREDQTNTLSKAAVRVCSVCRRGDGRHGG